MDEEEISVFIRMVALKVLATGCIYLVVNKPLLKDHFGIVSGVRGLETVARVSVTRLAFALAALP